MQEIVYPAKRENTALLEGPPALPHAQNVFLEPMVQGLGICQQLIAHHVALEHMVKQLELQFQKYVCSAVVENTVLYQALATQYCAQIANQEPMVQVMVMVQLKGARHVA
jgi:hypothetical protein